LNKAHSWGMKKRLTPQTLGFDVALVMLALLIAGCGGAIGPANTAAPADGPPPLESAIAELDSLIEPHQSPRSSTPQQPTQETRQ